MKHKPGRNEEVSDLKLGSDFEMSEVIFSGCSRLLVLFAAAK